MFFGEVGLNCFFSRTKILEGFRYITGETSVFGSCSVFSLSSSTAFSEPFCYQNDGLKKGRKRSRFSHVTIKPIHKELVHRTS